MKLDRFSVVQLKLLGVGSIETSTKLSTNADKLFFFANQSIHTEIY